eukprot:CAMPEP_0184740476 /NCGR_PEP_ID=MMETSP0315-20130426/3488_1 /TAXON_ID=101924 /ORGANISM="Rhodosorus marinus, Strain UTEX LB 2760" /LENGTH=112 /DNA_ID=CAMNT_0027210169 /DNA_START=29 /DNA_END=367 /DNA_ORIENTATION=+
MAFVGSFGGTPSIRNAVGSRVCGLCPAARRGRVSLHMDKNASRKDEEAEVVLPKLDEDKGLNDVEESTIQLPILDTDEIDEFRLMWKLKKEMNEGDFQRIFKSNDPRIGEIF